MPQVPAPAQVRRLYRANPVSWRLIQSQAKYIVAFGPRRESKCLLAHERLLLSDGRLVPIRDIKQDLVVGFDEQSLRLRPYSQNERAESQGYDACLKVITASGYELSGNRAHPLLTPTGWKRMDALMVGEYVATARSCPIQGHQRLPKGMPLFAGLMIGDGGTKHNHAIFTTGDLSLLQRVQRLATTLGWTTNMRRWHGTWHVGFAGGHTDALKWTEIPGQKGGSRQKSTGPLAWLRFLGLSGKGSHDKRVPEIIFTAPNDQIAEFIGAYTACDGHIAQHRRQIQLASVSQGLLQDIKHLLLRFGILSILTPHMQRYEGRPYRSYLLKINGPFVKQFAEHIPVPGVKSKAIATVLAKQSWEDRHILDIIPNGWQRHLKHGEKWHKLRGLRWGRNPRGNGRAVVGRVANHEENPMLTRLATSDIFWDRITAIEDIGHHEVFNVEVPDGHVYVASGGIISHNSVSCLIGMHYHVTQRVDPQYWPVRVAAVRDSRVNLGISTAPTIKEWFPPGQASHWWGKEQIPEVCRVRGNDGAWVLEVHFFGCDDEKAMSKFQGFSCGILWLEEPAPAATVSGGIEASVLGMGNTSLAQIPNPKVFIPMNPPDKTHWTVALWPELVETSAASEAILDDVDLQRARANIQAQSEVFYFPKGINAPFHAEHPGYHEGNRDLFLAMGRPDLVNRLVEGKVGSVQLGKPVAVNFSPAHVVPSLPSVAPHTSIMMSWDQPPQPACVIWRVTPGGYVDVLAAFLEANMGMQQFLSQHVKPWAVTHLTEVSRFQHTGDVMMTESDHSNSATSALKEVLAAFPGTWQSAPTGQVERTEPMEQLLSRHYAGRPALRISQQWADPLILALEGRWHRNVTEAGEVVQTSWAKNVHANVGEAFGYGCWLLERMHGAESVMERWRRQIAQTARERKNPTRTRL